MRKHLVRFTVAVIVGLGIYALRPEPPACVGSIGEDGFRRNLFRGVLPAAAEVKCND